VYISAGRTFQCSYDHLKLKFYRAFNGFDALHCQSHCSNSELLSIKLVKAYCVLLLLYAIELTAPAKQVVSMMDTLDRCIDVAVWKIFKLSCFADCKYIRSCVSLHPIAELVKSRTVKFMGNVVDNQILANVAQLSFNELFTFVS